MSIRVFLGTPEVAWLTTFDPAEHADHLNLPPAAATLEVPLFISHRRLAHRRHLPEARRTWALDSGAYNELRLHRGFTTTARAYAAAIVAYRDHIGRLDFAAPQDWPTDQTSLARTGRSVGYHLDRTVDSYLNLHERLGDLIIPVVQGRVIPDDYLRCRDRYERRGVDLTTARLVGVGSICGIAHSEATRLAANLAAHGVHRLHGFGVKRGHPAQPGRYTSIDSQVWSKRARHAPPMPGCHHARCTNCPRAAFAWYVALLTQLSTPGSPS